MTSAEYLQLNFLRNAAYYYKQSKLFCQQQQMNQGKQSSWGDLANQQNERMYFEVIIHNMWEINEFQIGKRRKGANYMPIYDYLLILCRYISIFILYYFTLYYLSSRSTYYKWLFTKCRAKASRFQSLIALQLTIIYWRTPKLHYIACIRIVDFGGTFLLYVRSFGFGFQTVNLSQICAFQMFNIILIFRSKHFTFCLLK